MSSLACVSIAWALRTPTMNTSRALCATLVLRLWGVQEFWLPGNRPTAGRVARSRSFRFLRGCDEVTPQLNASLVGAGTRLADWRLFPKGRLATGVRSMRRARLVSVFAQGWTIGRAALLGIAVLAVLAAPSRSPAQDAGVSGIPPGPANARGLNGSVNDPSGIGNAARVPALPPATITPGTPPSVSSAGGYRPLPMQRAVKFRRTRFAAS